MDFDPKTGEHSWLSPYLADLGEKGTLLRLKPPEVMNLDVGSDTETVAYASSPLKSSLCRKTLYTLNVETYAPEITALTYPLLKRYADKIGADFHIITERKFPEWPVTYEKFQIGELAAERGDDWSIYFDSDALIHPDFFDVTEHMTKDQVAHNDRDLVTNRIAPIDKYFRRDGRFIGSGTWMTVASDWTVEDLYHPIDDLTLDEVLAHIHPTANESAEFALQEDTSLPAWRVKPKMLKVPKQVITREHLVDDFALSRNIARYGLHFTTVEAIQERIFSTSSIISSSAAPLIVPGQKRFYLYHEYTWTIPQKVEKLKEILALWNLL